MFVINAFHTPFSFLSCLFAFCALPSLQAGGYRKISVGLVSGNMTGVAYLVSISFEAIDKLLTSLGLIFFICKMGLIIVSRSNAQTK